MGGNAFLGVGHCMGAACVAGVCLGTTCVGAAGADKVRRLRQTRHSSRKEVTNMKDDVQDALRLVAKYQKRDTVRLLRRLQKEKEELKKQESPRSGLPTLIPRYHGYYDTPGPKRSELI